MSRGESASVCGPLRQQRTARTEGRDQNWRCNTPPPNRVRLDRASIYEEWAWDELNVRPHAYQASVGHRRRPARCRFSFTARAIVPDLTGPDAGKCRIEWRAVSRALRVPSAPDYQSQPNPCVSLMDFLPLRALSLEQSREESTIASHFVSLLRSRTTVDGNR